MTDQDQVNELGLMHLERKKMRQRLACLKNKARRWHQAVHEGRCVLEDLLEDCSVHTDIVAYYPNRKEILSLREEVMDCRKRIEELNAALSD